MESLNREGFDTSKMLLADIQKAVNESQTRLAVVEEQQRTSKSERAEIKSELKDVKETIHSVDNKVDGIASEFAKLKGTWGGLILALSSIVAFLSLTGEYIIRWLKGIG